MPAADGLLVGAAGEDQLALLAHHDRGAGVLAHRQDAAGGDVGVLEQVEGDEPVVVGGLGVVEDVAQLLEVPGPQQVVDVADGLERDGAQHLGLDGEEAAARRLDHLGAVEVEPAPLGAGVVVVDREQLGEGEVRHGDGRHYDGWKSEPQAVEAELVELLGDAVEHELVAGGVRRGVGADLLDPGVEGVDGVGRGVAALEGCGGRRPGRPWCRRRHARCTRRRPPPTGGPRGSSARTRSRGAR